MQAIDRQLNDNRKSAINDLLLDNDLHRFSHVFSGSLAKCLMLMRLAQETRQVMERNANPDASGTC